MNILLKNISYLFASLLLVLPISVFAQLSPYGNRTSAESASATGAYHPPALYVSEITLDSPDVMTEVKGSFHVINQAEDIVGDVRYRVEVLSPLQSSDETDIVIADTPTVYAQKVSEETFAFIPQEERDIPFHYTFPSLPLGEYRLRVQLMTSQGKEMGWDDQVFQITNGTALFATLTHGPMHIPGFKDEIIPPTFGASVGVNSSFALTAEVDNETNASYSAFPVLDVYSYSLAGKKIGSITGSSITVDPKKSQVVTIPVTAETKPGVYYGVLTLKTAEGVQISSITDYRWIVRGESARIISARIAKLETTQGGNVVVNVDYAGPADASAAIQAKISISVVDEQGAVGTLDVPNEITLTDSIGSGEATVVLDRNIVGAPGLNIRLSDVAGNVLDTYTVPIPLTQEQIEKVTDTSSGQLLSLPDVSLPGLSRGTTLKIAVGVILVLLIGGYAIWKKKSSAWVSSLLFLVIMGSGLIAFPSFTDAGIRVVFPKTDTEVSDTSGFDANWKTLPNTYIVEMFVNKPIHNATYPKNNIPLEFNVMYGASNSDVAYAKNFFRYAPGVHLSTYEGAWVDLGTKDFTASNACGAGRSNKNKCFVTSTYVAQPGLNFTQQPDTATDATLQLVSKWGITAAPSSTLPSTAAELSGLADGINTWVKFATAKPTTTPTPLVCAPQARVAIDFQEIETKRANNQNPTLPISFFGNGEQAGDNIFVDLTKNNGQPVIDGKLPTNVDGLAVERGDGFITIQLYSAGRENKGRECVSADINLQNATFTSFQNVGSNWKVRSERPQDGKWRFCRNIKDEVFPGIGTSHAEMISAAGPKNDTFTLYYKTDAPKGLPVCDVVTPTPEIPTPTPTPDISPITNKPPISIAKISVNGANPASSATVTRGQAVVVSLSAEESSDPDGWTTTLRGVSQGGMCQWNSDLNQGAPSFERTIQGPLRPAMCNIDLGQLVFNDSPGTYTYNLLKITDAAGGVSNDGTVSITVIEPSTTQCNNKVDDKDPEDSLVDAQDPGCHTNNDITQPYEPTDDDEQNPQGVTPAPTASPSLNPGGFVETR